MRSSSATDATSETSAHEAAVWLIALVHAIEGCSQTLRGAIDRLAGNYELTTTQFTALWTCGESPAGIGQSRLAARIGVSPAQASALVEQLRRRNLLESCRTANDRRRQHWSLTHAGRQIIATAAEGLAALAAGIDVSLAKNQSRELSERLAELAVAIERSQSHTADDAFPRLSRVAEHGDGLGQADASEPAQTMKREVRR